MNKERRNSLHLTQDMVVPRLEGDVEELAHLWQLGACPDEALCEIPAATTCLLNW